MKVDWNSKYTTIAVYTIITFAVCLLLVITAVNFPVVIGGLKAALDTISPVIWGIAIAYLLNPIMIFFERIFKRIFERKKPHPRICRGLSRSAKDFSKDALNRKSLIPSSAECSAL